MLAGTDLQRTLQCYMVSLSISKIVAISGMTRDCDLLWQSNLNVCVFHIVLWTLKRRLCVKRARHASMRLERSHQHRMEMVWRSEAIRIFAFIRKCCTQLLRCVHILFFFSLFYDLKNRKHVNRAHVESRSKLSANRVMNGAALD